MPKAKKFFIQAFVYNPLFSFYQRAKGIVEASSPNKAIDEFIEQYQGPGRIGDVEVYASKEASSNYRNLLKRRDFHHGDTIKQHTLQYVIGALYAVWDNATKKTSGRDEDRRILREALHRKLELPVELRADTESFGTEAERKKYIEHDITKIAEYIKELFR